MTCLIMHSFQDTQPVLPVVNNPSEWNILTGTLKQMTFMDLEGQGLALKLMEFPRGHLLNTGWPLEGGKVSGDLDRILAISRSQR